jgi:hypothetical protein
VKVNNEEMLSARDLTRAPAANLDRLAAGDVEKLVLMKGSEMKFVVVTTDRYEELELAEQAVKAKSG